MSGFPPHESAPRVAVIGMACRFPGASNYTEFWNNLKDGVCSISEIPPERWSKEEHYSPDADEIDRSVSKWGGFIDSFDEFDAAFFGISPREAQYMDPQQRILLEVAVSCFEDAGYSQSRISGSDTAVYIGAACTDHWPFLITSQQPVSAYWGTGIAMSLISNRISHQLNLNGPSMCVDTACSSSLLALQQGVQSLRNGDCAMALVGGCSIMASPMWFKSFSKVGMLSPVGTCRTFDEKANGYVRGEGAGVVLLKLETQAIADGDRILGVVCGVAVNHGGHARTLTAPNAFAHARVITQAHLKAGISPDSVSYVEAHGTGTPVGDPIEMVGLKRAFAKLAERSGVRLESKSCAVGSVKPNVGHLEPAAGIAGLIKVLLCLQHKTLPKLLHFENLNPRIDLDGSPFYILKDSQPWLPCTRADGQPYPRRAGLSSFGFGGTNAHAVIEEAAPTAPRQLAAPPAYLVCLSAKTPEALRRRFQVLADWLRLNSNAVNMVDLSSTLLRGRQHWEYRSALVVRNAGELEDALSSSLQQDGNLGTYHGCTLAKDQEPDRHAALKDAADAYLDTLRQGVSPDAAGYDAGLHCLAKSYAIGLDFDAASLFAGLDARPIALPAYPFEKKRHSILATRDGVSSQPESKLPAMKQRTGISLSVLGAQPSVETPSPAFPSVPATPESGGRQEIPAAVRSGQVAATEGKAGDSERRASLEQHLRESLAAALYLRAEEVDLTRPFVDQGLDSVIGVEWVRSLNAGFGLNIAVTKLYDHPNIRALAVYIEEELGGRSNATGSAAVSAPRHDKPDSEVSTPVAVRRPPSQQMLRQELRESLAKALYLQQHAIREDQPFVDLGLDSVVGVEWVRLLNRRYGLTMQATRLYDYGTIEALASHIASELPARGEDPADGGNEASAPAQILPERHRSVPPGSATAKAATMPTPAVNYGLTVTTVQTLDEMSMRHWEVAAPEEGEVTIRVLASAINFADAMCVQGLYPTMPAYPFVPGFEVSGLVCAVGAGVSAFAVGDEVIAVTGRSMGGHASQVNAPQQNVIRKPRGLSHEEACSIPVVFSTVQHAFQTARLRPDEHVLVQTATGGCGLAAVQLARLHGCICYGTSSRPEKLAVLRAIGVEHAINYKTTKFDEEIYRISNGRGVDVVLNMLAGEAIQRGLNCLAPFGRYLELAVHGLRTSPKLDLSRLVRNQSVHSIDLRRMMLEGGVNWGELFEPLVALFEAGDLVPIVSRIYPVRDIAEALRYVAQGEHVGKVVISHARDTMLDCTQRCIERMVEQQGHSGRLAGVLAVSPPRSANPAPSVAAHEDIAVIGMSGQFPQAGNLDEFWLNLAQGKDCVTEVPAERWALADHFEAGAKVPQKTYCNSMGAIENVDQFDPLFFNIAPAEARLMDPEQRLFLQNVWHCFEDAGLRPSSVAGSRCGVFVGCAPGDYGQMLGADRLTAHGLMGGAASILSGRVAYFFNLQGPCLSIDTACSSSLAAITQACSSLVAGTSDLALAGGAYVMSGPSMHIMTSQAGMLSKRGRCQTFDQAADGFVPGEGVGVVLLKRLSDAERDGDRIYGVIKGWGIKQDGKTNGITAPSVNSQIALEKEVYERFAVDPKHITFVEVHGTGTKLGDPIEVEALTQSFRAYTDNTQYCALGSVKTNIGHGLTSAGIAGFIKVMLCLWHKKLVPSIHYSSTNEHIELSGSPFFVNTEFRDWDCGDSPTRLAAMSSFGFSGTNVHLVMEERAAEIAPSNHDKGAQDRDVLIVLSAKVESQLNEQARLLHAHLTQHETLWIVDVAYTLQTCREPMPCRLAFTAASRATVLEKLDKLMRGERPADVFAVQEGSSNGLASFIGDDADAQELLRAWMRKKALKKLAELWTQGMDLDWRQLHGTDRLQRVALPGYPFAGERYWLSPKSPAVTPNVNSDSQGALHPLLHWNVSTFGAQRFLSCFSGEEFFLADHRVRQKKVLPGVAYLEMALAAAARSTGMAEDPAHYLSLHEVTWIRPIELDAGPVRVGTTLEQRGDGRIGFEICIEPSGEGDRRIVCARGSISTGRAEVRPSLDLASLQASCSLGVLDAGKCYAAFNAVQLDYGPRFRGLERVYSGADQALAKLRLPDMLRGTLDQYVLHPAILDSAMQAAIGLLADDSGKLGALALPYSLMELQVLGPCRADMWAFARRSEDQSGANREKIDIDVCDENGDVCVRLLGFSLREAVLGRASRVVPSSQDGKIGLVRCEWQECEVVESAQEAQPAAAARVAIFCEFEGLDKTDLQPRLATDNIECVFIDRFEADVGRRFQNHAAQVLDEIKRLFSRSPGESLLLQLVYPERGEAQLIGGLTGMLRAAQLENPKFLGQLIGVDPVPGTDALVELLRADSGTGEPRVRYQNGRRLLPVWHAVVQQASPLRTPWKADGVYLITGGAGGLGLVFADDAVRNSPTSHVVLVGRSTLSAAQRARMREFWNLGGSVEYRQLDVSNPRAVADLITSIIEDHGRLTGIIHSAGVLRDGLILTKDLAQVPAVLAPKVLGIVNLDQASRSVDLDFFVAFSSMAGVIGNVGQADYAAGNGFMDAYARYRNGLVREGQRKGNTLSIDWPLWTVGGMKVALAAEERIRRRIGSLSADEGKLAFYQALGEDADQIAVTTAKPEELAAPRRTNGSQAARSPSTQAVGTIDKDRVKTSVVETIAKVLKIPADRLVATTNFEQYGVDSIVQTTVIDELETVFGELPKTLLFEHANIQELVEFLSAQYPSRLAAPAPQSQAPTIERELPMPAPASVVKPVTSARPARSPPTLSLVAPQGTDIAIIGASGRYPGSATLDELWQNLINGVNCVTRAPADRWEHSLTDVLGAPALQPEEPERFGGFLRDIDRFDHRLFGIDSHAVLLMAPELRLFLEIAWEAFEDAGYNRARLHALQERQDSGVGVFVGSMYSQYGWTMPSVEEAVAHSNESDWQIANRVSHFFDLTGPSIAVNTACSSSMTAIHLACESLRQQSCSMAIAGGVNLTLERSKYQRLQQAKFLDGGSKSRSFGDGRGYVPGEGAGAVLLKPLTMALEDGDRIDGIIKSSVVNHCGGRQKYLAPDPRRQAELIASSIRRANVDPETISYVESAANGSPLGDPIEVAALRKVFERRGGKRHFCALGSVKSNLGHLEAASGISQLSKVLLQLKHKTLVPTLHTDPLNPAIRLEGGAFQLQQHVETWHRIKDPNSGAELPLRSMINSFGVGGSFGNLIVEEFIAAPVAEADTALHTRSAEVCVFSAMTTDSLHRRIDALRRFVEHSPDTALADVAASLRKVNNDLPHRAAVVATSKEDLVAKLTSLHEAGRAGCDGVLVAPGIAGADAPIDGGFLQALGAWVSGRQTGLEEWPETSDRPCLSLPKYCFDHDFSFTFAKAASSPNSSEDSQAARGFRSIFEKIAKGELTKEVAWRMAQAAEI
jgi:acyl transferase domain-containing protein/D-arabinose 1-dehydrogenase-like Zn-dependent alcohol dehydrogenase